MQEQGAEQLPPLPSRVIAQGEINLASDHRSLCDGANNGTTHPAVCGRCLAEPPRIQCDIEQCTSGRHAIQNTQISSGSEQGAENIALSKNSE